MADFLDLFIEGLELLDKEYHPDPKRYHLLKQYADELEKWQQKVNLIAKTATKTEIIEKHFLDSLILLPELEKKSHLLDIGTGAGFPGLVCRTALPRLSLTLVEPRLKRVNFLRHIVRSLELKKDDGELRICAGRMTTTSPLCKKNFSHITCRAVSEIAPFLEMVSCFAGSGTQLLLMKGPKWESELQATKSSLHQKKYHLERVRKMVLPFSKAERFLLIFTSNME